MFFIHAKREKTFPLWFMAAVCAKYLRYASCKVAVNGSLKVIWAELFIWPEFCFALRTLGGTGTGTKSGTTPICVKMRSTFTRTVNGLYKSPLFIEEAFELKDECIHTETSEASK